MLNFLKPSIDTEYENARADEVKAHKVLKALVLTGGGGGSASGSPTVAGGGGAATKPLPALSQTVVNMTKNRDALTAREAALTTSIDKLTEERRQARVILETLDTALHALSGDPGLTDDDRALIGVTTAGLAGAVEADLTGTDVYDQGAKDDERDRRLSLAASGMSLPLANYPVVKT